MKDVQAKKAQRLENVIGFFGPPTSYIFIDVVMILGDVLCYLFRCWILFVEVLSKRTGPSVCCCSTPRNVYIFKCLYRVSKLPCIFALIQNFTYKKLIDFCHFVVGCCKVASRLLSGAHLAYYMIVIFCRLQQCLCTVHLVLLAGLTRTA